MVELSVDRAAIEAGIKRENRADAVRTTVRLYADAIRDYLRTEERHPDVWLVVVPDVVYRYGRPEVGLPPPSERTPSEMISAKAAKRFFEGGTCFQRP